MPVIFPTHIVGAACLVGNAEGQVLLMRHPGRGWEFPGGQVEIGEDLIAAVAREVEEETGIRARVTRMAGVYSNVQPGSDPGSGAEIPTKVILDFVGEYVSGEPRTSPESLEVGWFAPDEVLDKVTHEVLKGRLEQMLRFDGRVLYRAYSYPPYEVRREQWV